MPNKLLPLQWTIHHYITLIVDCTPFKCLVCLFFTFFFVLQDGAHYMIYTPSDPLLFVAVKVLFLICSSYK